MESLADEFKTLVLQRIGVKSHELECPHAKSDMTPCVARDGATALTVDGCCVGCGNHIDGLLATEKQKHT
jgi:uncharacterized metal-binding protein